MAQIIDIGEFRIATVNTKWRVSFGGKATEACSHRRASMDDNGQIVTCEDCGKQISPYWFLRDFFERYSEQRERLEARMREVEEAEKRTVTHRAALQISDAWARRKFLPLCPHCNHTIAPQDGFGNAQRRVVRRHEAKMVETKSAV
jgi:hypothetical protein